MSITTTSELPRVDVHALPALYEELGYQPSAKWWVDHIKKTIDPLCLLVLADVAPAERRGWLPPELETDYGVSDALAQALNLPPSYARGFWCSFWGFTSQYYHERDTNQCDNYVKWLDAGYEDGQLALEVLGIREHW